jgi:hypothetical protein
VTFLLWVLVGCEALALVLWLWGLAWVRRLLADDRMQLSLASEAEVDSNLPTLAVIIAAHNEQSRIDACLRSLLSQNYTRMRVIVADDRSEDATATRVRAVMARDDRVELVEVDSLPPGWIGKTHALSVAAQHADADYLLFMDCDCRFEPGAVAAVMRKAVAENVEFASLMPSLDLQSPAERLLTPPACWLLGLWAVLGLKRGEANTDMRLGNGQFMFFSREAYRKTGGHASVPAELAEDLSLAGKAAELSLRRWIGLGKGLYVTTRGNAFRGTVDALTRVLIGSLVKPWRLLVSAHLVFGGLAAPLWVIPLGLILAVSGAGPVAWTLAIGGLLHLIVMHRVISRLFGVVLEDRPSTWSFMLGGFACGVLMHWAFLVATGHANVRWGKTVYRVRGSRIVDVFPEATHSIPA